MGKSRKVVTAWGKETSITQDPTIFCILKPCSVQSLVTFFPVLIVLVYIYCLRMSLNIHLIRNNKDMLAYSDQIKDCLSW